MSDRAQLFEADVSSLKAQMDEVLKACDDVVGSPNEQCRKRRVLGGPTDLILDELDSVKQKESTKCDLGSYFARQWTPKARMKTCR